ncbi:unnamed protein product [Lathyrus sativus]|nr:unnamed protein product [Lathyrus sativus]
MLRYIQCSKNWEKEDQSLLANLQGPLATLQNQNVAIHPYRDCSNCSNRAMDGGGKLKLVADIMKYLKKSENVRQKSPSHTNDNNQLRKRE